MHRVRPGRDRKRRDASAVLAHLRRAELLSLYTRGSLLAESVRSLPRPPTAMGSYAAVIARALDARGISPQRVFETAGFTAVPHNDPLERVPARRIAALLDAAVEATHDPYFGLYAADFMHVTTFHALGYSLLASSSLRDFCERMSRHFRFAAQSATPRFDSNDASLEFVRVIETPPLTDDIVGLFIVRLINELSHGAVRPIGIALHRPTPPDGGARHCIAFGCGLTFGAQNTTFRFDRVYLDAPFLGASRELAEHNEQLLIAHCALYAFADASADDSGLSLTEIACLLGLMDRQKFHAALRCWNVALPTEHRVRPQRVSH